MHVGGGEAQCLECTQSTIHRADTTQAHHQRTSMALCQSSNEAPKPVRTAGEWGSARGGVVQSDRFGRLHPPHAISAAGGGKYRCCLGSCYLKAMKFHASVCEQCIDQSLSTVGHWVRVEENPKARHRTLEQRGDLRSGPLSTKGIGNEDGPHFNREPLGRIPASSSSLRRSWAPSRGP
jgi:hypothetical protein